jgi:hypothetical protein
MLLSDKQIRTRITVPGSISDLYQCNIKILCLGIRLDRIAKTMENVRIAVNTAEIRTSDYKDRSRSHSVPY